MAVEMAISLAGGADGTDQSSALPSQQRTPNGPTTYNCRPLNA